MKPGPLAVLFSSLSLMATDCAKEAQKQLKEESTRSSTAEKMEPVDQKSIFSVCNELRERTMSAYRQSLPGEWSGTWKAVKSVGDKAEDECLREHGLGPE